MLVVLSSQLKPAGFIYMKWADIGYYSICNRLTFRFLCYMQLDLNDYPIGSANSSGSLMRRVFFWNRIRQRNVFRILRDSPLQPTVWQGGIENGQPGRTRPKVKIWLTGTKRGMSLYQSKRNWSGDESQMQFNSVADDTLKMTSHFQAFPVPMLEGAYLRHCSGSK